MPQDRDLQIASRAEPQTQPFLSNTNTVFQVPGGRDAILCPLATSLKGTLWMNLVQQTLALQRRWSVSQIGKSGPPPPRILTSCDNHERPGDQDGSPTPSCARLL